MAKTVVGLFDTFGEAQSVVEDLMSNGFRREDISVVANENATGRERMVGDTNENAAAEGAGAGAVGGTVLGGALGLLVGAGLLAIPGIGPVLAAGPLAAAIGTTTAAVGATALGAGIGAATGGLIGGLVGAGVPKEDAEYYAEGVRRGGTLVSVNTDDAMAGRAHDIMNRHNVIDIDERATQWRSSGWTGFDASTEPLDRSSMGAGTDRDRMVHSDEVRSDAAMGTADRAEAVLPVVEESIDIDKRRIDKGGVRVTSRVEERPVEEQVRLHEERVNVERRPVDRPVTDADAFKETSFEARESVEEPVVSKRARVVEEIVVDTEARDRTETVRDSVRRTNVDVQQTGTTGSGTTGANTTGAMMDYDAYDNDYRGHYQQTYGAAGYTYDDYAPVYRYGHSLATDSRYRDRNWSDIETDARRRWEEHNPGTWEQFKDTVRFAWEKVRGRR
jgi:uncharacterized protein (TIGR02271 family)